MVRHARGAAAVEFALVLPVLMLLCLGAIEWGFHFFQREIIVNAAREGARAGSIADADAETVAEDRALAYLGVAGLDGTTCDVAPTLTNTGSPPTPAIRVSIDCTGGSFTLLFKDFMPERIVATAEMRR
ncbi:TadE/TadG family type IV pilus assembly protein [Anaeromyxobacter sp. Fw109-5]|uniref:TadE/TadG family type IV pilus assembly protein n=1 Tax=Anaeromyxobacter sp. (strain Fw109-5) TaxID=404589 RepID=UPI0002FDA699|nr:TadE family protein [Anaeromyxobacter sp. Fw109-5]